MRYTITGLSLFALALQLSCSGIDSQEKKARMQAVDIVNAHCKQEYSVEPFAPEDFVVSRTSNGIRCNAVQSHGMGDLVAEVHLDGQTGKHSVKVSLWASGSPADVRESTDESSEEWVESLNEDRTE
jgi:hypothetical protein